MKKTVVFIAVALMLTTAFAFADPGRRGPRGDGPGCARGGPGWGQMDDGVPGPAMLLNLADEIGLDEGQKTKISNMTEEFGISRIDLRAELDKARLELRHLKTNDASDAEVLSMMDKIGNLRTEMQKMRYTHRQAVKNVLTDQQIDKLNELRKEHRAQRGQFGHQGYGKGSGHGQGSGPGLNNNADCWRR